MSIELMLNGVNVAFVSIARFYPAGSNAPTGHIFVLLTMAVAAAEAAVGLAIVLACFRHRKTADTDEMRTMRW
jgi:NADH-quinone oxidoreductase subunit K